MDLINVFKRQAFGDLEMRPMAKTIRQVLVLMVAGAGLAACTSTLDVAKQTTPVSDPFAKTLYGQYLALSQSEHEEYDRADRAQFAERALAAATGQPSQPEEVSAREIPVEFQGGLLAARRQLLEALDGGARSKAPEQAARAQAAFDCWLQEREENFQPDDIQACRDRFDAAMAIVHAALTPAKAAPKSSAPAEAQKASPATKVAAAQPTKPIKKPEQQLPMGFTVYFAFDSARLDPPALATIAKAAISATQKTAPSITVSGYADRAGSKAYNLKLSAKRAVAVASALKGKVDDQMQISVKILEFGETRNQVRTADGVSEAKNRRVTIQIDK